jgi:hypothetical protein
MTPAPQRVISNVTGDHLSVLGRMIHRKVFIHDAYAHSPENIGVVISSYMFPLLEFSLEFVANVAEDEKFPVDVRR